MAGMGAPRPGLIVLPTPAGFADSFAPAQGFVAGPPTDQIGRHQLDMADESRQAANSSEWGGDFMAQKTILVI